MFKIKFLSLIVAFIGLTSSLLAQVNEDWTDIIKSMKLNPPPENSDLNLDRVIYNLQDTLDLKLFYLYIIEQRSLLGLETKFSLRDFMKEAAQLRNAAVDPNSISGHPKMPSLWIFDPENADETASELTQLQKQYYQKIKTLRFLYDAPHLVNAAKTKTLTLKKLYLFFKFFQTYPHSEMSITLIDRLSKDNADTMADIEAMRNELTSTSDEMALLQASYILLKREVNNPKLHVSNQVRQAMISWMIELQRSRILFSESHKSLVHFREDANLQQKGMLRFYQDTCEALSNEGLRTPEQVIDYFKAAVQDHRHLARQQPKASIKREQGYIQLQPLPRLLAFHLLGKDLKQYAFQKNAVFFRVSQGNKSLGLMSLVVFRNESERYYAIMGMPELSDHVMARLFKLLEQAALANEINGIVFPYQRRGWPRRVSHAVNRFTNRSLRGSMALFRDKETIIPEFNQPGFLEKLRARPGITALIGQRFSMLGYQDSETRAVSPAELIGLSESMNRFFESGDTHALSLDGPDQILLILDYLDRSGILEPLRVNKAAELQAAYKIIFEDRVQVFLEHTDPERKLSYIEAFIRFTKEHPSPKMRADSIDTELLKIMLRELGLSNEPAKDLRNQQQVATFYDESRVYNALLQLAVTDENYRVRIRAMNTLFRVTSSSLETVRTIAQSDPHPQAQRTAIWIIGQEGRPKDIEFLTEIVDSSSNNRVRSRARKSIKQIRERNGLVLSSTSGSDCERLME